MTDNTTPTTRDLMERINQLEERLAPPPKPSISKLLLSLANEKRDQNTMTVDISDQLRKARQGGQK